MTSERVDCNGVTNVAAKAAEFLPAAKPSTTEVVSTSDLAQWIVKDDVIMGGQSSSALTPSASGASVEWAGTLVLEGGGFCALTSPDLDADWSQYAGLSVRVLGDGQTLKFNVKTKEQVRWLCPAGFVVL